MDFKQITTQKDAYWLGFLYADGHLSKSKYCISVNLSSKDKGHLRKLSQIYHKPLYFSSICDSRTRKTYYASRFCLYSKKIHTNLYRLGFRNLKSKYQIAKTWASIPTKLQHHFIRGYFDGDGCISNSQYEYKISIAGDNPFLQILTKFLLQEGISSSIYHRKNISVLQIGGNFQVIKFKKLIYHRDQISLNRKKNKFDLVKAGKRNKTSKVKYVHFCQQKQQWVVKKWVNKKMKYYGSFKHETDAIVKASNI